MVAQEKKKKRVLLTHRTVFIQMAMLVYMNKHDDDTSIYKMVTSARVGYELYHRISNEDRLEQYQVALTSFQYSIIPHLSYHSYACITPYT